MFYLLSLPFSCPLSSLLLFSLAERAVLLTSSTSFTDTGLGLPPGLQLRRPRQRLFQTLKHRTGRYNILLLR
jgi:hypothetical protein